jgi:hypothetical protein
MWFNQEWLSNKRYNNSMKKNDPNYGMGLLMIACAVIAVIILAVG